MDKRLRESGNADLWDYRHAKLLLDVLAMDTNGVVNAEYHKLEVIKQLCHFWEVPMIVSKEGAINLIFTLELLAKHCLEHGRKEVEERKQGSED